MSRADEIILQDFGRLGNRYLVPAAGTRRPPDRVPGPDTTIHSMSPVPAAGTRRPQIKSRLPGPDTGRKCKHGSEWESESRTRRLTADPGQHLPADVADLWSESADWCGRNISGSAHLWSTLCTVAYVHRFCRTESTDYTRTTETYVNYVIMEYYTKNNK